MNKKKIIAINLVLLLWIFLDMVGLKINGHVLVSQSYQEDGLFFIIFLIIFILYVFYEKIGKYLLTGWLFLWFSTQFYFHWFYTIFGPSEGKINYFADTIKLISSQTIYIPDLYHIILHALILISLIFLLIEMYLKKNRRI
mgnify:CR=1 FL=1